MKFLHLSDSHLGESMPLYRTPPNNWRGEKFIKNYYRALKPALRGEVDFVLHAGDLFDKYHINMDIIGRAMVPLRQIASRNIPVFIVPGNHEREHIPGGLMLAGENIHIFSKPEMVEFTVKTEKVVIVGFPFIRHHSRIVFRKRVKEAGWKHKNGAFNILLCHQTFEGAKVGTRNFTFRNGEHVVPLSEIPAGFNYIACGHIHKQQIMKTKNVTVCYAGSTERVSFQELNEEKGYYIVEVKNGIPYPGFRKLSSTIMTVVVIDTTNRTPDKLIKLLEENIQTAKPATILRFHLHGEIELDGLKKIPLHLFKQQRNDIRVEFRKEDLVILKDRSKRFWEKRIEKKKEKYSIPYSIVIDDKKRRFSFSRKGLNGVPSSTGIYLLLNKDDRILYIGKAKQLRNRLISHLRRKEKKNEGFYFWLSQVKSCELVITGNELSALFLEMSQIRSNLPPYNKQIKEFRNYIYLVVKKNSTFPTIRVADEIGNDGNLYFGPFRKEYKMREAVRQLRELFGIRPCRRNLNESLRLFSCSLRDIGKCDSPCTGGVNPSEYSKRVEHLVDFLYGKNNRVLRKLEKERAQLASIQEFEKAAELQQKIVNLGILFNMLKRVHEATGIFGTLTLDFENGKLEKFPVKQGRVLWMKSSASGSTFGFPPNKWELDEMMLLLKAVESKDTCLRLNK